MYSNSGASARGFSPPVVLTSADWPRDFGLPADIIKGGMCISGREGRAAAPAR